MQIPALLLSCFVFIVFLFSTATFGADAIDDQSPKTLKGQPHLSIPGEKWNLIFSDEFNGSALNTRKWKSLLPWKGSEDYHWHVDGYASYITDEDVAVSGGQLHLTCRKMDIQGIKRKFQYTEGMVHTSNTFRFKYGYAEVSAKAPMEAGPGLWPAFWTLADGWPPEFDIIELWTGEPRIHQGYCFARPGGKGQDWRSYHEKIGPRGFHNYAMEWGPGYIFFSIDGKINRRVYGDIVTDKAQYLLLNSAVCSGKGNIGPTDKTIFPNSFDVEYCRVYARPEVVPFHNGGFEDEEHWPWTISKGVTISTTNPHTGKKSLTIPAEGGTAEQKIFGLKPGTKYTLTGWAISNQSNAPLKLLVKDSGALDSTVQSNSTAWTRQTIHFQTGDSNTTAVFTCTSGANGGGSIDDFAIEIAK